MNFRKINWKRILISLVWISYAGGLLFLLGFVSKKEEELIITKIKIEIDKNTGNYFIEKSEVNEIIHNQKDSLLNRNIQQINLDKMEKAIQHNSFIQEAQVRADLKGSLEIKVVQRTPKIRIINSSFRSFYIDNRGLKMPLSDNYTAHVLVANGNISEGYGGLIDTLKTNTLKEIYVLGSFISENEFWNAQIEQIYVDEDSDMVLIPRVGNHKIIFGDAEDMESKFENLMIFYKKALPRMGWNTYQTINMKFKNQIVCTKY